MPIIFFNSKLYFSIVAFAAWLNRSETGDFHPNPDPLSTSNTSSICSLSSNMSNTLLSSLRLTHNSSFVRYIYNVQSIFSKLEIFLIERFKFDFLAFTETCLNPFVEAEEFLLHSYSTPERKNRAGDTHGGAMIYVKDFLRYKRRKDLEPRYTENQWLELTNYYKHVLFRLFNRPTIFLNL